MTLEEKIDYISEYCERYAYCTGCEITDLCSKYNGNFELHPEIVEEAIKRIAQESSNDSVDHPSHYNQGNIECIDAMISAFGKQAVANFCMCNAFKYLWRSDHKNGLNDVDKAIWYLNKYKELLEEEDTNG